MTCLIPHLRNSLLVTTFAAGVLTLVGCERAAPPPTKPATPVVADTLPAGLFVSAEPAEAKEVKEVKGAAKVGDDVVLHGRIVGAVEPFVDSRAIFILADMSLPSCSDSGDDHCKMPWDACCEPKEQITAATVTIQVVGPGGQVLKVGLNGAGGLKPLAELIVKGRIAQKPDSQALVINATAIYVKSRG